jgi:choline kinase
MKAIILGAGQGKRLLPLTAARPKCLLEVGGRPILEWQLQALAANGIGEAVVVTGFEAGTVEEFVARHPVPGIKVRLLHNPFFSVSDNLASLFVVRHELTGPFLILNGDTLFEPQVLATLLAGASHPITVTIDHKPGYDADDMKVQLDGSRVLAIGKTLTADRVHGEAIGMHLFAAEGAGPFLRSIEDAIRGANGLRLWYLSAVDRLARLGLVGSASIRGLAWCEIDSLADLDNAQGFVPKLLRPLLEEPTLRASVV